MSSQLLRQLPSVSELLMEADDLKEVEGHQRVVDALRHVLAHARESMRKGAPLPGNKQLIAQAIAVLEETGVNTSATQVINATGVIIHTNLGRVVISTAAQQAMMAVASSYSPLEYDLLQGDRGYRGRDVERLLCTVTGAQAALVVNNCAAATVLMLSAIARGKAVVVSRGQLVEIGGGFRIPEIMEQSGARLIEVGTTNRTRRSDYEKAVAIDPEVSAILSVHSSNFQIVGFTESVSVRTLVEIGAQAATGAGVALPVLDDLGSGALLDTAVYGLRHEPMPQESVSAGAALVTFSGDKLVGGPQAGILVGRQDMVERCRRHPLARAFRADKFTLAGLTATLMHYLRGEAAREIPVWQMISVTAEEVGLRVAHCLQGISPWLNSHNFRAETVDGLSTVGGGALPGEILPTKLIAIHCDQPEKLVLNMRLLAHPVIARIKDDAVMLDLRTVLDDQALAASLTTL
jgi:L-seryl-tRNA(Ser) seleniumtransferase